MIKLIVAHSLDIDTSDAIEEILDKCLELLVGKQPEAGLLFSSFDYSLR